MSRRQALKYSLGIGAMVVTTGLLAACGGDDDDDDSESSTQEADGATTSEETEASTEDTDATETTEEDSSTEDATDAGTDESAGEPVSGGTLIRGLQDEPPILDPRVSGDTDAWRLFYNMFDQLVSRDRETNEFLPALASSWEISDDGTVYTFELLENVQFHDGTPFNAEAVQFTFDSILEPELKSLTAIGYLGPYAESVVVDDYTVEIHFDEAYAPFLANLSHSVLSPVSPAAVEEFGDEFGRNPVGTGPFKFKEWEQQISIILEKNPDYDWPMAVYKHEGPAYLDGVEIKIIPEASTLFGTLENGETDIIDEVLPQEVSRLQEDPNYQIWLPPVPGSPQILPLNCTKAPTDDINVRKAILHAVDMETVVESLWFGTRKAAQGPLSSPTWGYNPAVEDMYPFDPEKAISILEEGGWTEGSGGVREKDGQKLHLEYITVGGIQGQAGEFVQAYLTDVGMEVNLQQLEYAATAAAYLASEHNIARIYFSHTDPVVLTTLYHSRNIEGTNFNRTMLPDDELDQMLEEATSETDPETRKQMYADIQIYIMEDARILPLWEETVLWGANANVQGVHFQPLGGDYAYDIWKKQ